MMDGNLPDKTYQNASDDFSSFCLHDARMDAIKINAHSVCFEFSDGIMFASTGQKTPKAIVEVLLVPSDISVFIGTPKTTWKTLQYKFSYIPFDRFSEKWHPGDKIEIIDVFSQGSNHFLWKCALIRNNRYANYLVWFELISCENIQWKIYF